MSIFDLANVDVIEFGICKQNGDNEQLFFIPTHVDTKQCLKEMLSNTCKPFESENVIIEQYEISQKYSGTELLTLRLNNQHAERIKSIYDIANIESQASEINDPEDIIYYFCKYTDTNRNKLIAFRRATFFKALQHKSLLHLTSDFLQVVEDKVFKLDHDFDFMATGNNIYIRRPQSFDFIAQVENQTPEEVHAKTLELGARISFLNPATLAVYASTRKMAARYIASISSRSDLHKLSHSKVQAHCAARHIELCEENNGVLSKIWPADKHEMQFLKLLDRRLLELNIIDEPEYFEAAHRKKMN